MTQYKDSLGTFVEQERIRKRHLEGIDEALQNCTIFGQPKITVTEEFKLTYNRYARSQCRELQKNKFR